MITGIEKYYKNLCDAYDRNEWFFTQNEDRAHNATIMRVMLEKSEDIRMYCGEMSVFRESFYNHIEREHSGLGSELRSKVADALGKFLKKTNSRLQIILEEYDKSIFNDLIIPFRELNSSLGVEIYRLPDEIGNKKEIPHVAFTRDERMVRIELDKTSHEAICKIGTGEDVESPTPAFERLLKLAKLTA